MIRKILIGIMVMLTYASSAFGKHDWPEKPLGGDECLFFDEQTFIEARERIDSLQWAKKLYIQFCDIVRNGYTMPADYGNLYNDAYWAEMAAIYYRISGDEQYLERIEWLLRRYYRLDHPDRTLFSTDPKHKNPYFWQRIMENDCRYILAYDLLKKHPLFSKHKEIMEKRMDEIIREGYLYESRITRLGNTHFFGVTGLGLYGFMRKNHKAIATAINGRNGFKGLLSRFRDGGCFWPEPKLYTYGYVDCCILMLAEAAKFNNWEEDLYEYVDPENGASIKKMILAFITSCTPDGFSVSNGEHSEFPLVQGDSLCIERPAIFTKNTLRENTKLPIYYRRYKDPVIGWAMQKFPEKDYYCVQFWNFSALLYGADVEEVTPPDAQSLIYPGMGDAIVRSDESEGYWDGNGLTVYFRNGASQQFHGHNDHFSININTYGKNLFNHWFYNWDYLCPRKSRPGNTTPLSQKLVNHNTVVVDFKEPDRSNIHLSSSKDEIAGVRFSEIKRSGNMKIISAEGEIYDGVRQKRLLGVTDEYVIDIFSAESDSIHNYDYTLHSWGKLALEGIDESSVTEYAELNREYGLRKIDGESTVRKENVWLSTVEKYRLSDQLTADFRDEDTGIVTRMLYEPNTSVISAYTPMYISVKGWDDGPQTGFPERKPMLIVRKKAESATFIAIHQPYRSHERKFLVFSRKGNTLIVKGDNFTDRFNMEKLEYTRRYKK